MDEKVKKNEKEIKEDKGEKKGVKKREKKRRKKEDVEGSGRKRKEEQGRARKRKEKKEGGTMSGCAGVRVYTPPPLRFQIPSEFLSLSLGFPTLVWCF